MPYQLIRGRIKWPEGIDQSESDLRIPLLTQVALRWALQKPGVAAVIIGAKSVEQLEDNLAAWRWSLTEEEMTLLDELSAPEIPYPYEMIWRCNQSKGRDWVLPTTWH